MTDWRNLPDRYTLERAAIIAHDSLVEHYGHDRLCILGVRTLREILALANVPVKPVAVSMLLLNRDAAELGPSTPPDLWPAEAWSVGVDANDLVDGSNWNGHLVGLATIPHWGTWLVDPTFQQFSRPERDMTITRPLVHRAWEFPEKRFVTAADNGDWVAVYERSNATAWRKAPDWRQYRDNIGSAVRKFRGDPTVRTA